MFSKSILIYTLQVTYNAAPDLPSKVEAGRQPAKSTVRMSNTEAILENTVPKDPGNSRQKCDYSSSYQPQIKATNLKTIQKKDIQNKRKAKPSRHIHDSEPFDCRELQMLQSNKQRLGKVEELVKDISKYIDLEDENRPVRKANVSDTSQEMDVEPCDP